MILAPACLLLAAPVLPQEPEEAPALHGPATAWRVDLIETLDGEPVRNGTVLVRDGIIEKIGPAVILPEDARIVDLRGTGASIVPPWVVAHAGFLPADSRGRGRFGKYLAVDGLYLGEDDLQDLLKEGVLLLGVDPRGSGIPGRTSVLRTDAEPPRPEPLVQDLHLRMTLSAQSSQKELLRKALTDADAAIEKEEKARKEWEKARKEWEEKQKAEQKKAEEQKKQEQKNGAGPASAQEPPKSGNGQGQQKPEEKEPPKEFQPPPIDPNLKPVVEWLRRERMVQVTLDSAAAWLHWLDLLGERELPWELVLAPGRGATANLERVAGDIGGRGLRVYLPARLYVLPDTRIRCNLARELEAAGARLVLEPPSNSLQGVQDWRVGVADLVREGLERSTALRAMSLEPAAALGQEELVHPLKPGSSATFLVLEGDPLDPLARVARVVVDGRTVYERDEENPDG